MSRTSYCATRLRSQLQLTLCRYSRNCGIGPGLPKPLQKTSMYQQHELWAQVKEMKQHWKSVLLYLTLIKVSITEAKIASKARAQ